MSLRRWWRGDFDADDRTWGSGWPWDLDVGAAISNALTERRVLDQFDLGLERQWVRDMLPVLPVRRGPISYTTPPFL